MKTLQAAANTPGNVDMIGNVTVGESASFAMKNAVCATAHRTPENKLNTNILVL